MATKNSLTNRNANGGKMSLQAFINSPNVQNVLINRLGSEMNKTKFVSTILSATSNNPALMECDNNSIISCALLAQSLNLSPSPQLGQFYMVPFNDKNKGKVATSQIGYRGYVQLAIRSGYYKKINVVAIKEGELVKYDPLEETIEVNLIDDVDTRENTATTGYYAMFEYLNGFRKTLYWSRTKMQKHAETYSQGYKGDLKRGTAYTFWSKNFDDMAMKTMLRQLISRWGIMSTELETAFANDMTFNTDINSDSSAVYFDNSNDNAVEDVVEAVVEEKPVENNFEPVVDRNGNAKLF